VTENDVTDDQINEPKTKASTGPFNADDDVTDSYEPEPSSEE